MADPGYVLENYLAKAEVLWAAAKSGVPADDVEKLRLAQMKLWPEVTLLFSQVGVSPQRRITVPDPLTLLTDKYVDVYREAVDRDALYNMETQQQVRDHMHEIEVDVQTAILLKSNKVQAAAAAAAKKSAAIGIKVVFCHGRSEAWRALKDFVADELKLPWAEYNSESTVGMARKERLEALKAQAAVAIVVMTAEDTVGNEVRARENVVHEIGYFQGAVGWLKTIVVQEERCAVFSNMDGTDVIRFIAKVDETFEKVRQALKREKLVK